MNIFGLNLLDSIGHIEKHDDPNTVSSLRNSPSFSADPSELLLGGGMLSDSRAMSQLVGGGEGGRTAAVNGVQRAVQRPEEDDGGHQLRIPCRVLF